MEYLKTQQHPAENDSMDLKRAQPTQPQDLGCHQQTDNCNNATDSTDNPKVLENQGELHIEVSSVDHDISALTDVVQKTHALGSNSKSLNGVVLTEQSTSLVGATVLSSSRLDSRHHDLSRHLDSMFTDVTLELQAKDTTISQLVHTVLTRLTVGFRSFCNTNTPCLIRKRRWRIPSLTYLRCSNKIFRLQRVKWKRVSGANDYRKRVLISDQTLRTYKAGINHWNSQDWKRLKKYCSWR